MRGLAVLAAFLALGGCGKSADWTGFVYPYGVEADISVEMGRYETFEQCQAGAINALRPLALAEEVDYACGRGCRFESQYGMTVCRETRD